MAPASHPRSPASAAAEAQVAAAPRRSVLGAGLEKFSEHAFASVVIALIIGLMMLNLNETNGRITRLEESVTRLEVRTDTRFVRLEEKMDARFVKLEDKFVKLEDKMDARLVKLEDKMDAGFADVDSRLTRLEENQLEILRTLALLVALAGGDSAADNPSTELSLSGLLNES